jgi:phosphate transport system permease protein
MTAITPPSGRAAATLANETRRERMRKWRQVKDKSSKGIVSLGGGSVIVALGLMFVYLFSEVVPMFLPASVERVATYDPPGNAAAETLHLSMERYRQVARRVAADGTVTYFRPQDGGIVKEERLPLPDGVSVSAYAHAEPRTRVSALGLSNGQAIVYRDEYELSFPEGRIFVTPGVEYPLGAEPVAVDEKGQPIRQIAVQDSAGGIAVAAITDDGRLLMVRYETQVSFMTGETRVTRNVAELPPPDGTPARMLLSADLRDLFVADTAGRIHHYDVTSLATPRLTQSVRVVPEGTEISALEYLLGSVSLIVGGSDGSLVQWFMVRDDQNVRHLTRIRAFDPHPAPITAIAAEHTRKGFATADSVGNLRLHFPTSHRTVARKQIADGAIPFISNAPRADALLALDAEGRVNYFGVENEYPQVSFSALWNQVWYEGYGEPDYVWQSSSATDEFESKFSLVPLTLGTIKAAFYAMMFAMPLAIMGAIYSAYFMSPKMRGVTKPAIEIMEALPTVILGFLAGLWFAPFVERHLPAVFSILLLLPIVMLIFAYLWGQLPRGLKRLVPDGWEAALLIPVILLFGWLCVSMSPAVEVWFFDGSMRQWLTDQGYTYDQRNALVVGIAMGFAVIPTIYSITEDAVFGVPKHLTQGSLALGATTWQTLSRVVLLTASPGIFSAVMIGLGRAVGETMIVLMATGNSPIVNFNIFEGMRTLSANIAVEMPEAEFGGTHYRILFLSALVLFILTFTLNTAAEVVRQRLRKKYASI